MTTPETQIIEQEESFVEKLQNPVVVAGVAGVAVISLLAGYYFFKSSPLPPMHVVGLGNPLLDICVVVEDDVLLKKYGLKLDNAILAEESHMPLFEEIANMEPTQVAGGACLNSIRACRWMSRTPESASFIGAVGGDANATTLKNIVRGDRVDPVLQVKSDTNTGRCAVIVQGIERSLVSDIGAARTFETKYLKRVRTKRALEKGEIFYVCGFFLDSNPEAVMELGEYCRETNKMFVFNISAEFVTTVYTEEMINAIAYADIVVCNEGEAAAFASSQGWETSELSEIARMITELPKKNLQRDRVAIITCGSDSTKAYVSGEFVTVPVPKVERSKIVDTNGAGDSFVGGLLAGLSMRKTIKEAINAGHACAAYTIGHTGTSFNPEESTYKW